MKIPNPNMLIDGHAGRGRPNGAEATTTEIDAGMDCSAIPSRNRNSSRTAREPCTTCDWLNPDLGRLVAFLGLLFLQAIGLSACGGDLLPAKEPQRQSQVGAVTDTASLIGKLRAAGADVEAVGEAEQPFLSVTGTMIKLDSGDVQVFEFPSAAEMDTQVASISRDGTTVGTSRIRWIGLPHFFKQGKVLVLYVGNDAKVLRALETVLGSQFAGR